MGFVGVVISVCSQKRLKKSVFFFDFWAIRKKVELYFVLTMLSLSFEFCVFLFCHRKCCCSITSVSFFCASLCLFSFCLLCLSFWAFYISIVRVFFIRVFLAFVFSFLCFLFYICSNKHGKVLHSDFFRQMLILEKVAEDKEFRERDRLKSEGEQKEAKNKIGRHLVYCDRCGKCAFYVLWVVKFFFVMCSSLCLCFPCANCAVNHFVSVLNQRAILLIGFHCGVFLMVMSVVHRKQCAVCILLQHFHIWW